MGLEEFKSIVMYYHPNIYKDIKNKTVYDGTQHLCRVLGIKPVNDDDAVDKDLDRIAEQVIKAGE